MIQVRKINMIVLKKLEKLEQINRYGLFKDQNWTIFSEVHISTISCWIDFIFFLTCMLQRCLHGQPYIWTLFPHLDESIVIVTN